LQNPAVIIPDSSMLVEKIVKLQRTMAKKQDKVDFLEEHVNTLLEELKKKNRIIQSYVMVQESGTLASNEMDNNKVGVGRRWIVVEPRPAIRNISSWRFITETICLHSLARRKRI
jgi:hypothetical protein